MVSLGYLLYKLLYYDNIVNFLSDICLYGEYHYSERVNIISNFINSKLNAITFLLCKKFYYHSERRYTYLIYSTSSYT